MQSNKLIKDEMQIGIETLPSQMNQFKDIYQELMLFATSTPCTSRVLQVKSKELFERALTLFGPQIIPMSNQFPLHELYEVAIHLPTAAIIVASRAATIPSKTTIFSSSYTTHFQAFSVYMPGLGVEVANVGRVGEINSRPYVLRSESACTPSFLFGSQQCNCASQWRCTQELAAYFNSDIKTDGEQIGFLMVYLESQNGMGMGYTPGTFAIDLGTRAHLRHAAGLALSQNHQLSIQETFAALGLPQDPRRASNGAGYKITPIILDFLHTHSELILLSNNPMKIKGLKTFGYSPHRLKTLGEITTESSCESQQRAQDFEHLDIGSELTSFDTEFQRLKIQIQATYNNRGATLA
jgi:GTP cyclohydrolase II